ncbi:hypothetical protein HNP84_004382 [Thermocatellispora tengchongensis]|uniref:DUF4190 domain-containing protein n=1 Tax=Thermocatellispora tengchongensis TaxID=1073253 RepID=A0A840P4Q0_9ACTN|nr:hypothetical protein [Thermocatellispora tengchongensis]MBB5134648.1 hypothetical protein [Thermocatellispora tengchongensis]
MTTPAQIPTGQRSPEAAGRRAVWLALAALVMTFMLPIAGLVLAVLGLTAGIRAQSESRKAGRTAGAAVTAIVISAVSSLIALGYTALQLYFAPEITAYGECKIGAGTVAAENDCVERLERAMEKKMPFLRPGELQFPFAP